MKLKKASESLSRLDVDPKHPWPALEQMNQIMDASFWESLAEVHKHAHLSASKGPEEIKPRVRRKRKRKNESIESVVLDGTPFFPSTDVFQTDQLVILCCDVPGFVRNSLEVTLLDEQLVEVKGQIREHVYADSCTLRERTYGSFCRRVKLPAPVSGKGIRSQYQDGLLDVFFIRQSPGGVPHSSKHPQT